MKKLDEILQRADYQKIRFKVTKTNHLLIRAAINGVKGNFILDTGASNSCVDFSITDFFKLSPRSSDTMAAGAGAVGMMTQVASRNKLKVGRWKFDEFELVIFDLSHVNTALEQHKAKPVQGIIGADVLLHGKAVIDYFNQVLYLQKSKKKRGDFLMPDNP